MKPTIQNDALIDAPLGKRSSYINQYTPSLLFPIPRKAKREEIGVPEKLPFRGFDTWNAFELSWLNPKGKPIVALAEFQFPCESPSIIESKSFKLYLNSFNNSKFASFQEVAQILESDLSKGSGSAVQVKLIPLNQVELRMSHLEGICLDELDVECEDYLPNIELLSTSSEVVKETVFTDLLKSNCLVTGQPDWGSLQITYEGRKIQPEGLLKYIVSLRDHNEFHEQCVERIFMDISRCCQPEKLAVSARYTRRGGLDINPFRSNYSIGSEEVTNPRLVRQ